MSSPADTTDVDDVERPLDPAAFKILKAQYEKEGQYVGIQTKFNYAWALIKSDLRPDQQEGVRLLSEIVKEDPERQRECIYYLALGNFKLGNYGEARRCNNALLEETPDSLQSQKLESQIDDKVNKEGLLGVGILGALVITTGLVGGLILKGLRKR